MIPVALKKDGSLTRYSRVGQEADFRAISRFTEKTGREIARPFWPEKTEAEPCRTEKGTACDFCPYRGVCGFDEKLPGFSYRRIHRRDPAEILKKMREEARPMTAKWTKEQEEAIPPAGSEYPGHARRPDPERRRYWWKGSCPGHRSGSSRGYRPPAGGDLYQGRGRRNEGEDRPGAGKTASGGSGQ